MQGVIKKDSGRKGKILSVFCGVHGNEKVGILAVKEVIRTVTIRSGAVYFVFANLKAIEKNKRFVDKNLNRCFFDKQDGTSYEEKRANDLIKILKKSDALLDIHASNCSNTIPFVITENSFEIVKGMNFKIIATGFDNVEPGATDEYMKNRGKIGICLECGYAKKSTENVDLAYNSILQFLQYFDAIEDKIPKHNVQQKFLHVSEVQKVTSKEFKLTKTFADFEELKKGFVIATDKGKKYIAKENRVILFGSPGKPIGAEAYILGKWVRRK